MAILASLPNHNLFSSLPTTSPKQHPSSPSSFPPPIPIPKYPPKQHKPSKSPQKTHPKKHPSFTKIPHNKTKYYKPISPTTPTIIPTPNSTSDDSEASDDRRAVVIGDSGVSYLLPGAPFEFKFSYSETPRAKPVAIREPAFLPFAPPTMPRPWTGKAPLLSKKEKLLKKKKIPLFDSFNPVPDGVEGIKRVELMRSYKLGEFLRDERSRDEIIGEPLSRAEVKAFVKPLLADNRQVNLGRDGLTHNMLELIHSHWKRQEVCKVKCKGVPTVDMDNVCRCLEDKTGGKIIHRTGGVVYLFRGRYYNYRTRPQYPVMLWKPAAPVYPKLIQDAPEGLTKREADELRKKGRSLLAICKLAKNGVYVSLVTEVRQAFEGSELAKVDCRGLDASDYKKIGAKLMELVPCVLLSFEDEQILMWRGPDWKSMYPDSPTIMSNAFSNAGKSDVDTLKSSSPNRTRSSPRMMSLWERAIQSNKALLLDQTNLEPDALLTKVEEFQTITQAVEHSYPALLYSGEDISSNQEASQASETDEDFDDWFVDEEEDDFQHYSNDLFEDSESPGPLGSLPVDLIAEKLHRDRIPDSLDY